MTTGTLAGVLATIIVAVAEYVGTGVSETAAAAIAAAATALVAYLTRSAPGEPGPPPVHHVR